LTALIKNPQNYILGYGSLMNITSLKRALRKEISRDELLPVTLVNFQRTWSASESVFSEKLNRIIKAIFLDAQPAKGKYLNGIIFEASEEEIQNLALRERNYELVQVTGLIKVDDKYHISRSANVFTFTSKMHVRAQKGDENSFVLQRYVQMVEDACLEFGEIFQKEYRATTEPIPFELLDGGYRFVDEEQARHV
jgi:cation transport regulator ChaC